MPDEGQARDGAEEPEVIAGNVKGPITIAFTGVRPNRLYGWITDARYEILRARIARTVRDVAAGRPVNAITGGAQGADQLAFHAVEDSRRLGVDVRSNVVYIPFAGQANTWSRDGIFGEIEYDYILEQATDVKDCSKGAVPGTPLALLYKTRDRAMANAADVLVAVVPTGFDVESKRSDTAYTMRVARSLGKPIVTVMAP